MLKNLLTIKWSHDFTKSSCIEFFVAGHHNCGHSSICAGNSIVWGTKFLNSSIYLSYQNFLNISFNLFYQNLVFCGLINNAYLSLINYSCNFS